MTTQTTITCPANVEELGLWFEQNRSWLTRFAQDRYGVSSKQGICCEDAIQLTAERCIRKFSRYDPSIPIKPWVLTTLIRVSIGLYRMQNRLKRGGTEAHKIIGHSVDDVPTRVSENTDFLSKLTVDMEDCIKQLPESQQRVIRLAMQRCDKESNDDLAVILGITKQTFEKNQQRGRRQLKPCLESKGYGNE